MNHIDTQIANIDQRIAILDRAIADADRAIRFADVAIWSLLVAFVAGSTIILIAVVRG